MPQVVVEDEEDLWGEGDAQDPGTAAAHSLHSTHLTPVDYTPEHSTTARQLAPRGPPSQPHHHPSKVPPQSRDLHKPRLTGLGGVSAVAAPKMEARKQKLQALNTTQPHQRVEEVQLAPASPMSHYLPVLGSPWGGVTPTATSPTPHKGFVLPAVESSDQGGGKSQPSCFLPAISPKQAGRGRPLSSSSPKRHEYPAPAPMGKLMQKLTGGYAPLSPYGSGHCSPTRAGNSPSRSKHTSRGPSESEVKATESGAKATRGEQQVEDADDVQQVQDVQDVQDLHDVQGVQDVPSAPLQAGDPDCKGQLEHGPSASLQPLPGQEVASLQLPPGQEAASLQLLPGQEAASLQMPPGQEAASLQLQPGQEADSELLLAWQDQGSPPTPLSPSLVKQRSAKGNVLAPGLRSDELISRRTAAAAANAAGVQSKHLPKELQHQREPTAQPHPQLPLPQQAKDRLFEQQQLLGFDRTGPAGSSAGKQAAKWNKITQSPPVARVPERWLPRVTQDSPSRDLPAPLPPRPRPPFRPPLSGLPLRAPAQTPPPLADLMSFSLQGQTFKSMGQGPAEVQVTVKGEDVHHTPSEAVQEAVIGAEAAAESALEAMELLRERMRLRDQRRMEAAAKQHADTGREQIEVDAEVQRAAAKQHADTGKEQVEVEAEVQRGATLEADPYAIAIVNPRMRNDEGSASTSVETLPPPLANGSKPETEVRQKKKSVKKEQVTKWAGAQVGAAKVTQFITADDLDSLVKAATAGSKTVQKSLRRARSRPVSSASSCSPRGVPCRRPAAKISPSRPHALPDRFEGTLPQLLHSKRLPAASCATPPRLASVANGRYSRSVSCSSLFGRGTWDKKTDKGDDESYPIVEPTASIPPPAKGSQYDPPSSSDIGDMGGKLWPPQVVELVTAASVGDTAGAGGTELGGDAVDAVDDDGDDGEGAVVMQEASRTTKEQSEYLEQLRNYHLKKSKAHKQTEEIPLNVEYPTRPL
eukprot:gene9151-16276_t